MQSGIRHPVRRCGTAAVAFGLALAVMPPAWADRTAATSPDGVATEKTRSVTLITGDRVVVADGAKTGTVKPGPGRRSMSFSTTYTGGHLFVVPHDASFDRKPEHREARA